MTTIQFKDTKATLKSFHCLETYDGWLEGHPIYVSWYLLKELWGQLKREEFLVYVHKGEVISPDRLNDIEHFDSDEPIFRYIEEVARPNGIFSPKNNDNIPFIVLKRAKYVAHCHIDQEYLLTMVWYDEPTDTSKSVKEMIESVSKNIEYKKYCKFVELD